MRTMRSHAVLWISLGLLCWSNPGQAADCSRASDQASLDICADQGLRDADHQLNQTYQALIKTISPAGAEKLRVAEHTWLAYRDAQCAFETFSKDGSYSAEPMVRANCLKGLTELHARELDAQRHCAEGDIGCGMQ